MKSFVFSLARMRNYKEQVLNKEKNLLGTLRNARNEIERHISDLENYRILKSAELVKKQSDGMDANELSSHRFYMENSRLQLEGLQVELIRADEAVEQQLKVVVAASQELSSLDKLEEKQREEYQLEATKENANQVSEYIVSALSRKSEQP